MNSISLRRLARRALFMGIWFTLTLALVFGAGLRFNPTPSLPKGIYRLTPETPARGDLVSFCLEGEFAELALERGYLEPGSCPSGLRPLLKRLAALPGDSIDPSAFPLRSVDSHRRSISPFQLPRVVPSDMALVLADHPGSFDSRYFGFVPLDSLQRVEPVFVINPKEKENDHAKQRIFTRRGNGHCPAN